MFHMVSCVSFWLKVGPTGPARLHVIQALLYENRVLEAVIVGAPRPCSGARCLLIGLGLFPIITVVSLGFVGLISFISLGFVASLSRYPLAFLLAEPSP